MKIKAILAICCTVLLATALLSVLPVNGEEKIYSDVIRLHVLANSDYDFDQELKLKVRDAILTETKSLGAYNSKGEAQWVFQNNIGRLTRVAENVIAKEGYNYPVYIELGQERYPERSYEDFTLPAGDYTSLRVIIGEGEGQNWWCVVYPPLCTTAASEQEETFIAAGFTDDQYRTITNAGNTKYKIKFKIVEIIKEIFREA